MSTKIDVSVIIPVYNEDKRLTTGVERVISYLTHQRYRWELILVDDGSKEPVQKRISKMKGVSVIRLPKNMGKGRAIAAGVSRAKGKAIVFTDVDLSVGIEMLKPMLAALREYPVVIGSRRKRGAKILVHQPVFRESAGRVFTVLSNFLCATHVADVTCGFKGFTSEAAKSLFSLQKINRWVFDTEVVFLARKKGLMIYELPVAWVNKEGSKVRPWDSVTSLIDLIRIRLSDARGEYN